jgi:hypothetical protein
MLPGLTLAAGVTLMTLALATPANAADVEVRLEGLPSRMTIGDADSFAGRVQNNGDETFEAVQRVIVVRMDGLTPEGVRIARGGFGGALHQEASGDGEVRFVDPLQLPLGNNRRDTLESRYQIRFTEAAQPGQAEVVFEAFAAGQSLGSDSDQIEVRLPRGALPSPTKPVHTDAPPTGGVVAEPSGLAPIDGDVAGASGDQAGGVPVIFYVLGGVLVLAGGAILWLLFHGPRPALVDSGYAGDPGHQGPAPRHARFDMHSTAVLPAVRGPHAPPGGAPEEHTRDLRGNPGRPR